MPVGGKIATEINISKMANEMGLAGFGQSPHPVKKKPKVDESKVIDVVMIGADVEEFLRNKEGKPVPVCGLIGGTKDKPMPVIRSGFALQEDNVALEYNIPPASNVHEFVYNLMRIREEILERTKKLELVPAIEASMRFDMKDLQSEQARTFGCEPDYNVWEQRVNEKPDAGEGNENLRTAGGHVHISFTVGKQKPTFPTYLAEAEAVVMACDIYLGVPFSLIDKDRDRRLLYGKAGAFRPKPEYGGVEYRVLSNKWTQSPELMSYVYKQVLRGVEWINGHNNPRERLLEWKEMVYKAINEGDEKSAYYLMNVFHINLPKAA